MKPIYFYLAGGGDTWDGNSLNAGPHARRQERFEKAPSDISHQNPTKFDLQRADDLSTVLIPSKLRGPLKYIVFFSVFLLFPQSVFSQSVLQKIESETQRIFKSRSKSVVFIASGKGFGSGFYVSPTLILTNAHVVGKAKEINIVVRGGKRITGRVVDLPKNLDLALVEVKERGIPIPLLPSSGISVGSWVGAIGHGEGGIWTFTTGMISNLYSAKKTGTMIQTQIPINEGNSGGPIVDRNGYAVGVATAKSRKGENLNFAIPVEDALRVFMALRVACVSCLKIQAKKTSKIFLDGKLLTYQNEYVLLVRPGKHEILFVDGSKTTTRTIHFPETKQVNFK